ncbi:hypothetical protein EI94DRAFT_1768825 [Lactarius quietus]|nr:hypothetical protein EI94DRAFT_1768825 [Lactarius quietus]
MTTWRIFLVDHAKFPFPVPEVDEDRSYDVSDISRLEVGSLSSEWKAQYAKLCSTLDIRNISEDNLLSIFGPRLQFLTGPDEEEQFENPFWDENRGESSRLADCRSRVRTMLEMGIFQAASICLYVYGHYSFRSVFEDCSVASREDDHSGVDYDKPVVLTEAEWPFVMEMAGKSLPVNGFKLTWARDQSLVVKLRKKAALRLAQKKMEWMFLSCFNYWIVCRLIRRDNGEPFLAYSPSHSMENSSEIFRAVLGDILSVQNGVPVQTSAFDPGMEFDDISEEKYFPLEGNIAGSSGARSSSEIPTNGSHAIASGQPGLTLTHFLGSGSTGKVWKCHFDNSDALFAIKVVELLHYSDSEIYRSLEMAYHTGQLRDRITPHFYGAFKGDGIDALILELGDFTLHSWDELGSSERNIIRIPGGGFRLIDFSSSRRHTCKEFLEKLDTDSSTQVPRKRCYELKAIRKVLKPLKRKRTQASEGRESGVREAEEAIRGFML